MDRFGLVGADIDQHPFPPVERLTGPNKETVLKRHRDGPLITSSFHFDHPQASAPSRLKEISHLGVFKRTKRDRDEAITLSDFSHFQLRFSFLRF